jgi:hypothetical protein
VCDRCPVYYPYNPVNYPQYLCYVTWRRVLSTAYEEKRAKRTVAIGSLNDCRGGSRGPLRKNHLVLTTTFYYEPLPTLCAISNAF